MTQADVDTLRAVYEAFNRSDIPAVLTAFDPQIEWNEPGGGQAPSGIFHGPASVGNDVFATVPEHFAEFRAEPDQFIDAGGHVVVTGRFRGTSKSGRAVDAPYAHVFQMRDGKAVSFHNHVAAAAWAEAWSSSLTRETGSA